MSFSFIIKIIRRNRLPAYPVPPKLHTLPHYKNYSPDCIIFTENKPALMQHNYPKYMFIMSQCRSIFTKIIYNLVSDFLN